MVGEVFVRIQKKLFFLWGSGRVGGGGGVRMDVNEEVKKIYVYVFSDICLCAKPSYGKTTARLSRGFLANQNSVTLPLRKHAYVIYCNILRLKKR